MLATEVASGVKRPSSTVPLGGIFIKNSQVGRYHRRLGSNVSFIPQPSPHILLSIHASCNRRELAETESSRTGNKTSKERLNTNASAQIADLHK
jgi:hypothetical protein